MTLSNRELFLGWATGLALLLGLTYWGAQSKVEEWRKAGRERDELSQRVRRAQRTLETRDEWVTRFETKMGELPAHPVGKDVTAELMRTIERTAQDHGLILRQRDPQPEEGLSELYQLSINCTWEGELKALVHFLYAVHTQGAILDIRQFTVTPVQGQTGQLKGGFTVDCAYRRTAEPLPTDNIQVTPAL